MPSTRHSAQRGTAILMAILTVALVAAVASAVIAEHGAAIEQLAGRSDQAQSRWLARGAIDWARNVLEFDRKRTNTASTDHLGEEWAIRVPATPVDEGDVSGEVEDLSARLNINLLVKAGVADPTQQSILTRLFEHLRVSPREAQALVDAISDWLDQDQAPAANGAERAWYSANKKTILPANAPLVSINELLAVRGMTPELLDLLKPHLCALPADASQINVNTASAEVIAALIDTLPLANAQQIVINRQAFIKTQKAAYATVADFTKLLPTGSSYNAAGLSVQSRYFQATGRARWGEATTHLQVILKRDNPRPDIVRETLL